MMRKNLYILLLLMANLTAGLLPANVSAYDEYQKYNRINQYDAYFRKYTKRVFGPTWDWKYFKAQAIAESNLNPDAKSWVGAQGLMQILPSTYKEITRKNIWIQGASPRDQRWGVAAGIAYMKSMWNKWTDPRPFKDRLSYAFGSYNAGRRNILRAQKIARKKGLDIKPWDCMETSLPKITGTRSEETLDYVKKIHGIRKILK